MDQHSSLPVHADPFFGTRQRPKRAGADKHLSIVGWRLDVDPDGKQQPDLLYSAECENPVHEKTIREFKTWIGAELSAPL